MIMMIMGDVEMPVIEHRCGGKFIDAYTWKTKGKKIPRCCPRCKGYLNDSNYKIIKEGG